jgi:hypothetical protein
VSDLSTWLERQARREEKIVYLEEALLGNRFWRYSVFRLRFFFARYALASAVHAVNVVLLYRFFPETSFVLVLVAYAAAGLVSNFWWGALEAMRGEVRRLYRSQAPHLIPRAVGRWLSLSLQLTLVALVCTLAWLGAQLGTGTFGAQHLYLLAILLGLSLQFFTRAYHSGIYAIRRIYRPLPAILGVELAGVAVALASVPLLGAWALPLGALVGVLVMSLLTLVFTRRAYAFLGLSPAPHISVGRLRPPPRSAVRDLVGGGSS